MNTRLIFTAAALPADQARAIVGIICSSPSNTFERTRTRMQKHFEDGLVRVIKFAKHETLRKLQRYMHSHRPLIGQDEPVDEEPQHPDAQRIVFDPNELRDDLLSILLSGLPGLLGMAFNDTMKSLGATATAAGLPRQAELDFIARRQNLLANVPDEIFQTIKVEIARGLLAGEPIRDLSKRITNAFDLITKERAQLIAETETAAAYGFASHAAAVAAGVSYKKWLHSVLPKVPRPDHLAIHGLVVPIDQPYPVGDPQLMYPHDGNGAAKDVINCRCISIPATEEDFRGQKK